MTDPDWLQKRQQEMDAARKKMQEELNAKAVLYLAKMKEVGNKQSPSLSRVMLDYIDTSLYVLYFFLIEVVSFEIKYLQIKKMFFSLIKK